MNSVFAAKLLQNLRNKKGNKGFTLIELLVVVIIIGVLAAVALPNLLGQVGKARETEAKNGVGTINRAQQAYHFEKRTFSPDVSQANLAAQNPLGVILTSDFYEFSVDGVAGAGSGDANNAVIIANPNGTTATAGAVQAENNGVRTYAGGINHASGVYDTVVCQSNVISNTDTGTGLLATTTTCDTTVASELR